MTEKKVYFYKVKVQKAELNKEANEHEIVDVDSNNIHKVFKNLFDLTKKGDDVLCPLANDPDKTVAEFVTLTDNDVFGRIGKEEDINYLRVRNNKNNKGEELNLAADTYAEKCTYFYYNFTTGVLCYISIGGAPRYSRLERILSQLMGQSNYAVSIMAIINEDSVGVIAKKAMINSLNVKVAVPCDKFLGCDNLGLSKNDFVGLNNAEYITIELSLHGKRFKGITDKTKDKNVVLKIFEKIKNAAGKNLESGKAKGFNPGEHTREYDLIEELVTFNIELPDVSLQDTFIKEIEKTLRYAYNERMNVILELSK